ncbi:hypothetical protein HDU93_000970 [Gonapodya sp. JEL0774]|nr:hypothetical protein HDU93_000970 [Gonapodya sp. JEL0774]
MPVAAPRNLEAKWYTSTSIFDAEKRTIFRTSWLFCTNVLRLKAQKVFQFEVAGHEVKLCLAPESENLAVSAVCADGAPLAVHVTPQGFVFINFAGNDAVPFTEFYKGLDEELLTADFNPSQWIYETEFVDHAATNWKCYIDNYAECYHCPTGHPVTFGGYDLKTYRVDNKTNYAQHQCARKVGKPKTETSSNGKVDGLGTSNGLWVWLYPNAALSIYSDAVSCMVVEPVSPTTSRLRFQVFFRATSSSAARSAFLSSLKAVVGEDLELSEGAQRNFSSGIWGSGVLHPTRENGVVYFQKRVREDVGALIE